MRKLSDPDARAVASFLAAHARSLTRPQGVDPASYETEPLTLTQLKEIGRRQGIRDYEFNAPLVSEGELLPLDSGGFRVRISRGPSTSRARFSIAHEIGHTFFYDLESAPPKRLATATAIQSSRNIGQVRSQRLEESFCDAFASELLLPRQAALSALEACRDAREPLALLTSLEATSRQWGVSVEASLRRLNETLGLPPDMVAIVLRWKTHVKSGLDPALRVTAAFPRPSMAWFVPSNQRAGSIGLNGAMFLHHWWQDFPSRKSSNRYRRSGVLSLELNNGVPEVVENSASPRGECIETLCLWTKDFPESRWRQEYVRVPVVYRFYLINESEAYCLAIVDASRACECRGRRGVPQ